MPSKIDAAARALITAHRTREAMLPPYDDLAPSTADEAYAVQQAVWQAMVGDKRPSVWKIGAASRDAEPVAAPVFPQRVAAASRLEALNFRLMGIEAEIAVCFGQDLPPRAEPYTREEVLDAVASAHVAMELVDTRLVDSAGAGYLWCLADNLLNGGFVLGEAIASWRHIDPATLTARSYANGKLVSEVTGRSPNNDPFFLLPWWANHGSLPVGGIQAGDVVTTGSWNGSQFVTMPVELRAEFAGLGTASVHIV